MYQVVEEAQNMQEQGPRLRGLRPAHHISQGEDEGRKMHARGDDGDDLRIMQHFVTNLIDLSNET